MPDSCGEIPQITLLHLPVRCGQSGSFSELLEKIFRPKEGSKDFLFPNLLLNNFLQYPKQGWAKI